MARLYRTPTDRKLQAARARAQRKRTYWDKRGIVLDLPPRVDVRTATGSQKLAEIRALERFSKADPGVPTFNERSPIPKSLWREHQRKTREVNKQSYQAWHKYRNVEIGGQKLGTFNSMRYGDREDYVKRLSYARTNTPPGVYSPIHRVSTGFSSRHAVERHIQELDERLSGQWQQKMTTTARDIAMDMMKQIGGRDERMKKIESMTDTQIDVLVNMTPFMHHLKLEYEEYLGKADDKIGRIATSQADDIVDDVLAKIK